MFCELPLIARNPLNFTKVVLPPLNVKPLIVKWVDEPPVVIVSGVVFEVTES